MKQVAGGLDNVDAGGSFGFEESFGLVFSSSEKPPNSDPLSEAVSAWPLVVINRIGQ
jgi:hypothetical protein